jgi:hypothetical protein
MISQLIYIFTLTAVLIGSPLASVSVQGISGGSAQGISGGSVQGISGGSIK